MEFPFIIILAIVTLFNFVLILSLISRFNRVFEIAQNHPELTIGDLAPSFSVYTAEGNRVNLINLSEQHQSTIFFFMLPNCTICSNSLPILKKLEEIALKNDDTRFIYVLDSDLATLITFVEKYQISPEFSLAAARDTTQFTQIYNPSGAYPYYVIINSERVVKGRGSLGDDTWNNLLAKWEPLSTKIKRENIFIEG